MVLVVLWEASVSDQDSKYMYSRKDSRHDNEPTKLGFLVFDHRASLGLGVSSLCASHIPSS